MTRHIAHSVHSQQHKYFLTADIHLLTPMHVQSNVVGWYEPTDGKISRDPIPGAARCALTATCDHATQLAQRGSSRTHVPVIPAEVLANRLLRVAESDYFARHPILSSGWGNALHGECVEISEPIHPHLFVQDSPKDATTCMVEILREVDPYANLHVMAGLPVLKSLRGTFDPEPQVHALPFRVMEDMTYATLVKPLTHSQGILLGRIEPREIGSPGRAIEPNSNLQDMEEGSLKVEAMELVLPGLNFHIQLQIETSDTAAVAMVSRWLQGLMREAQIGACGRLGQVLGRFECKASGLYSVHGQNGCPSPITSLFRSRQSGYSLRTHPLLD